MNLGFVLYDYFPFGGLERDCHRIASLCAEAGHEITLLTRTWQGERPSRMKLELFGRHGITIPARNRHFVRQLAGALPRHALDGVIGFNKLPGLDVYYGADPCYAEALEKKPFWCRWLPRYRQYLNFERAVFQRGGRTDILQYTPRDIPTYKKFYGTEDRFHVLPPNARRHAFTAADQPAARRRLREQNGWSAEDRIVLFVGSNFQRKGLDRLIRALAALEPALRERTRLGVMGRDDPGRFARLAEELGVAARVHFLGGRHDVPEWMLAADVMAHPARRENTGSVLVEALSFGLSVLATDVCGYASHINAARAGQTFPEPFDQAAFDRALQDALSSGVLAAWRHNAWAYAKTGVIFGCHRRAAEIILETIARRRAESQPQPARFFRGRTQPSPSVASPDGNRLRPRPQLAEKS
jgi:UDP-glucose:(heptosyl)LPS alpha-1,3-glucosyltransferase